MSDRARHLLRADVMRDFEPAHPSLETRVFDALERGEAARPRRRPTRLVLQAAAIAAIAMVTAGALVAHAVLPGAVTSPAGRPSGEFVPRSGTTLDLLSTVQFVSADVGWVVRSGVGARGAIFKTSDGGRHWTEQLDIGRATVVDVQFWAGGGGIVRSYAWTSALGGGMFEVDFVTADGGAHWTQRVLAPTASVFTEGLTARFALSKNEAWRLQADTTGVPPGIRSVDHTADGGRTWTPLANVAARGLPFGSQLFFRDSRTGWLLVSDSRWLTGDAAGHIVERSATPLVSITHDGGRTWAAQQLALPAATDGMDIRVGRPVLFGARDGVLPVMALPVNAPRFDPPPGVRVLQYVFRTTDGGQTWTAPVELPDSTPPPGEVLLSATHWLVADGAGVRETLDAGRTWTSRPVDVAVDHVSFTPESRVDQRTIVAQFGPTGLVRSADGGRTWTAIVPPGRDDVVPGPTPSSGAGRSLVGSAALARP